MKVKTEAKKLKLHRDTLRCLSGERLEEAKGGIFPPLATYRKTCTGNDTESAGC
jgi:hypothetical protein